MIETPRDPLLGIVEWKFHDLPGRLPPFHRRNVDLGSDPVARLTKPRIGDATLEEWRPNGRRYAADTFPASLHFAAELRYAVGALHTEKRGAPVGVARITRDAVNCVVERSGRPFRFVDTAGIRRKVRRIRQRKS